MKLHSVLATAKPFWHADAQSNIHGTAWQNHLSQGFAGNIIANIGPPEVVHHTSVRPRGLAHHRNNPFRATAEQLLSRKTLNSVNECSYAEEFTSMSGFRHWRTT